MSRGQQVRRTEKFSDEPRIQGPRSGRRIKSNHVDVTSGGDWYLIVKHLEHNGVAYLPLNHHLVEQGAVPERVPSMGAKGNRVGELTVPVDVTGRINTADMKASEVWQLYACGCISPIDPTKSHARLMEGKRMSKTITPAMIPPLRRVSNVAQTYQQATQVPLTVEGMQNRNLAMSTLPSPFGR
jgi:hypothetical protein